MPKNKRRSEDHHVNETTIQDDAAIAQHSKKQALSALSDNNRKNPHLHHHHHHHPHLQHHAPVLPANVAVVPVDAKEDDDGDDVDVDIEEENNIHDNTGIQRTLSNSSGVTSLSSPLASPLAAPAASAAAPPPPREGHSSSGGGGGGGADAAALPGGATSVSIARGNSETGGNALAAVASSTSTEDETAKASPDDPQDRTSKDYYFDSYSHHSIHEEMLKDEVRTKTYQMAILQNKHLFHDKIVLDVGCGTGILSMFAAQAGAKHVYAVDCSSILEQAKKIVEKNGFSDRITLIRGKIEEIELPVAQVDIIVSEWMGYFLLYESMLDTVIFARDKWLVPNGVILPDKAVMYIAGLEDGLVKRERFDFWKDVYGFDMSAIKDIAIKEPVVDVVDAKAIVTDSKPILHLDILSVKREDVEFVANFRLHAQRNDFINGLVCYFEVAFTQVHKPIGFSTAPFARYTHWKQTIFYMEEALTICAGECVTGEISCKPNKRNRRDLDITVELKFKGRFSELEGNKIQYRLR